jgi:hypothetical protein
MADKSTRENVIEDYLVRQAHAHGGDAYKLRPPTGRGFPDRTLVLPLNWVAFVEVKRPVGGVVAQHQKKWRRDLEIVGQRYYLVATLEEVDEIFNDYKQEIN